MGDWNLEPSGNDCSQEWLINAIETPVLKAIGDALDRFFADASDDVRKFEAEAAIALLLDLANNPPGIRYVRFNFAFFATEQGLWDRCISAIRRLQSDTESLQQALGGQSHKKLDVLKGLLNALERSESRIK